MDMHGICNNLIVSDTNLDTGKAVNTTIFQSDSDTAFQNNPSFMQGKTPIYIS